MTLREVFLACCKLSLHLSLIVSINSAASGLDSERARSARQGPSCSYDSLIATAIYYSWPDGGSRIEVTGWFALEEGKRSDSNATNTLLVEHGLP